MAPVTHACPYPGCGHVTAEGEPAVVAQLLLIHSIVHQATVSTTNLKKPDRPEITQDMSESAWAEFVFNWGGYKRNSRIAGKEDLIRAELQECCTKSVKSRLFAMLGDQLLTISENDLLASIKSTCVEKVTITVHRERFSQLTQTAGENPQSFLGRLRAQAALCSFTVTTKCSQACAKNLDKSISYLEAQVESQLITGLANPEHRAKILTEASKFPLLSDKMDLLDNFHTTENSENSTESSMNQRSEYSRQKIAGATLKCKCGKILDSKNPKHIHCKDCFDKMKTKQCACGFKILPTKTQCAKCAKKKSDKKAPDASQDSMSTLPADSLQFSTTSFEADSSLDSTCTVSDMGSWCLDQNTTPELSSDDEDYDDETSDEASMQIVSSKAKLIDSKIVSSKARLLDRSWGRNQKPSTPYFPHSEWDENLEAFVPTRPLPQPMTVGKITVLNESMVAWKVKNGLLPPGTRAVNHRGRSSIEACMGYEPSLADSGAQTSSITPGICEKLGLTKNDYLPTKMVISGASGNPLQVEGAILASVLVGQRVTRQMMYVIDNPIGPVLSKKALIDLGIIPKDFPNQQEASINSTGESKKQVDVTNCDCLPRTAVPSLPEKIPFEPIPENRGKLESFVKSHYASSAMNTCGHKEVPEIMGEKMKFHFIEGVKIKNAYTPAQVPYYHKEETKALLDRDVALGVIEKVPEGTPTTACSRMIMQVKKNGSLRRTIDLQQVNKATYRETHYTATPFRLVSDLPPNQKKTTLDCWNSYHALPLDTDAKNATCFVTEWGTYRYRRAPQGFHASGDAYTRRCDEITSDFPNKRKCIDDTLLYSDNLEENFWQTMKYIKLCGDHGIVFNPDKFEFGKDVVEFAGFELNETGFKPTMKLLQAISDFPIPKNITDVRAWFGLVEQVSYAFSKNDIMLPFRELLKRNRQFYWDENLTKLFLEARDAIVAKVYEGVGLFEIGRTTCLTTDYSKEGIGFFLQQKTCDCEAKDPHCHPGHWRLILAGSRFTKDAERNYAPIEGEALAMAYGLECTKMYCLGNPDLIVGVDHQPLVSIMGEKPMDQVSNPRLLNFKQKCVAYKYKIFHIPGRKHVGPDVASRYPSTHGDGTTLLEDDLEDSVQMANFSVDLKNSKVIGDTVKILCTLCDSNQVEHEDDNIEEEVFRTSIQSLDSFETLRWEDLSDSCKRDEVTVKLVRAIKHGFPESREDCDEDLKKFYHFRYDLYVVDEVPMINNRMYVPDELRPIVLESLHAAHQGVSGMKSSARGRFYWPQMDNNIAQVRAQCRKCNERQPSQHSEEWLDDEQPTFPFEIVCLDYFDVKGSKYLAQADAYSGWLTLNKTKSTTFTELAEILRGQFMWHGVPHTLATDGGPPFNSEAFREFCRKWKIHHRLSSATYSQSNGRAELAVKTGKRMLEDNTDVDGGIYTDRMVAAMVQYKNTPLRGVWESPAEILYGHNIEDNLPRAPQEGWRRINDGRELGMAKLKMNRKESYNIGKKNLEPLKNGDLVLVQNVTGPEPLRWSRTGTVIECLNNRQYSVKMDGSRRVLLRNRKHLKLNAPLMGEKRLDTDNKKVLPPKRLSPSSKPRVDRDKYVVTGKKDSNASETVETPTPETPKQVRRDINIVPSPRPEMSFTPQGNANESPLQPADTLETPVNTPRRAVNSNTPRRLQRTPSPAERYFSPESNPEEQVPVLRDQPAVSERPRRERKAPQKHQDFVPIDSLEL